MQISLENVLSVFFSSHTRRSFETLDTIYIYIKNTVVVSWSNKSVTLSASHYEGNGSIRETAQLFFKKKKF